MGLKKLQLLLVCLLFSTICFSKSILGNSINFEKLYNHDWWELWYRTEDEEVFDVVLVRLGGDNMWHMKKWYAKDVDVLILMLRNHNYSLINYECEKDPVLFGDYRVKFNCDYFPELLSKDKCIDGIKKAY